jgi:uncharacterized protein YbaR (Trm112 family)
MHLLLTDILTCPVCGPEHGLILRADVMANRRVREGALGCPNCRRAFPVQNGVANLRVHDAVPGETVEGKALDPASSMIRPEAVRIAALLGAGTGFSLIAGPAAAAAREVSEMVPDAQIVVVDTSRNAEPERTEGEYDISRIVIGDSLPFSSGKLSGIWLSGPFAVTHLSDAVRALHPTARLVLEPAPSDARERLQALGMRVVVDEGHTMLAIRASP